MSQDMDRDETAARVRAAGVPLLPEAERGAAVGGGREWTPWDAVGGAAGGDESWRTEFSSWSYG
jgi:hypothetical protein